VPFLCQTSREMVGVAGFEPATPSSRTRYTPPKLLKLLTSKWRKSVNETGNDKHICAESVQRLLRVAAVQLPRQTPEDRAALLPYVKRDMR
jgi:hypothetical protein